MANRSHFTSAFHHQGCAGAGADVRAGARAGAAWDFLGGGLGVGMTRTASSSGVGSVLGGGAATGGGTGTGTGGAGSSANHGTGAGASSTTACTVGMATIVPHWGHLMRLPACSSLTCMALPQ